MYRRKAAFYFRFPIIIYPLLNHRDKFQTVEKKANYYFFLSSFYVISTL
jgi:hypothetical protein